MDLERAQELINARRDRVERLLASAADTRTEDNEAERDAGDGDTDGAQPLEHESVDLAIERSLREQLAALDRAQERIANGSYGFSLESGAPIPDARLEVDPAAELTVDEAAGRSHHPRGRRQGEAVL
jgi:DnaK suppressor protein